MMFYKETDFKETPMGRNPTDWSIVKLGDILMLLRNGVTTRQNKEGKGYPVTRIETISEETIDRDRFGYLLQVSEKNLNEYRLIEGDILFSHINSLEHIGKTAIYKGEPKLLLHGMNLLLLRTNKDEAYAEHLLYVLKLFKTRNIFRAMAKKAVNQASINQTELGTVKISLPPLLEQQKIAEVLSIVDETIQKTSQVIAKTERLKKGLMQELLTRGIGHKEFKDTEIRRIPKKWEAVRLGEIAAEVSRYPTYYNITYEDDGVPEIRGELIKENGELQEDLSKYRFISEETSQRFPRTALQEGDFVLSVRGTMGKVAIVPKFLEGANITANLMRISLDRSKCYPQFFKQVFLSDFFRKTLEDLSSQTTIKTIQAPVLKSITTPLPPFSEQQRIASILLTVDKKVELERKEKARLERIKQGLMDLLLTGKIRVKVN